MALDGEQLVKILEASLLVAGRPLNLGQIDNLFEHEAQRDKPSREAIKDALATLQQQYEGRGVELVEVASGFRIQARQEHAPFVANLFQEKTPRYSRALLETLVLIAYRQPITRGEVEDVRGVAVSTNIIKTLMEREWIRVLGHRDVPGRPAIYGTTRQFLDYFNLKRIDELPTLSEIKELDQIDPDLAREMALLESTDAPTDEASVDGTDYAANVETPDVDADSPELPEVQTAEAAPVDDSAEEITADEITYEEPEAAVADSSGDSAINVEAADAPEPEASLAEIEPTADQTLMDDLTAHEST
ncbi:MAG: SMC-Scp complex subunit ScpB, partial [Gammaproteobacteria bacterium]|nr:SMC-Scp complex subunit ScpB [Gammaproteobacteria bacterium]